MEGIKKLPRPKELTVIISLCVLLLVVSGIIGYTLSLDTKNYQMEVLRLESEIIQRSDEVVRLRGIKAESKDIVQAMIGSASVNGKLVAELQNNYKRLDFENEKESYLQNSEALRPYFVHGEDGHVEWYMPSTGEISSTWMFKSVYTYVGDSLDVVWFNVRDEDGALLAYSTAVYSTETKLFTNLEHHITTLGQSYVVATSIESSSVVDDIDSLIGDIQALVGSDTEPMTQEELDDLSEGKDAQQALRDLYEEGDE